MHATSFVIFLYNIKALGNKALLLILTSSPLGPRSPESQYFTVRSLAPVQRIANGIRAEMLPEICGVYLKARREGKLHPSQEHMAVQAEVLMGAFARVGIVALVDEATGYQKQRGHDALRLLLSKYIAEGLQK